MFHLFNNNLGESAKAILTIKEQDVHNVAGILYMRPSLLQRLGKQKTYLSLKEQITPN